MDLRWFLDVLLKLNVYKAASQLHSQSVFTGILIFQSLPLTCPLHTIITEKTQTNTETSKN